VEYLYRPLAGKDIPVTVAGPSTGAFDHVAFNAEDFDAWWRVSRAMA